MRRFIIKVVLFSVLFYTTFYCLSKSINKNEGLDKELKFKIHKLLSITKNHKSIIIAGDSRAERQLIPKIISRKTGCKCINLGVSSGELVSFMPYLKLFNPDSTLFVFSLSSWQINDALTDYGYLSLDAYNQFNFFERCYLYRFNIRGLFKMEQQLIKNILRKSKYKPTPEKEIMLNDFGYLKMDGIVNIKSLQIDYLKNRHIWYKSISSGGLRLRLFKTSIDKLCKNNFNCIIYQPPISPSWHKKIKNSKIDYFEKYFSNILKFNKIKSKRLQFLDFYNMPVQSLSDSMFCDAQHLNIKGALKFSNLMIDSIKKFY